MNKSKKVFVGIDIAKAKCDGAIVDENGKKIANFQFNRTKKGFLVLKKRLDRYEKVHVVFESTGGYERSLSLFLADHSILYSCVNPRYIRDFSKGMGLLVKTDKTDAKMIALYGLKASPRESVPPTEEERAIETLSRRNKQLDAIIIAEKTRVKESSPVIQEMHSETIKFLEQQQKNIMEKLMTIMKSSEDLKKTFDLLKTAPGVGDKIALFILGNLVELGNISARAASALVGVAPYNQDSGTYRGKRRIKGGRGLLRRMMYMGVTAVVFRSNNVLSRYYKKLRENGKVHKVAIIACLRKLVCILNSMLKSGKVFDKELHL